MWQNWISGYLSDNVIFVKIQSIASSKYYLPTIADSQFKLLMEHYFYLIL